MKQGLFVLEKCFDMFSYIYIYIYSDAKNEIQCE